jgi:hypothetical protein
MGSTYDRGCITKNISRKFHARKGTSLQEISNEGMYEVRGTYMIGRRNFALIYRNDCTENNPLRAFQGNFNLKDLRQESNSTATYYSTNDHDVESCSECLNSTTNGEDQSSNEECPLSSNDVSHATSCNGGSCGMLVNSPSV